jgi:hypothetical protein
VVQNDVPALTYARLVWCRRITFGRKRIARANARLNAGHNGKYFNEQRGVTCYEFMNNQFAGIQGIVIPGTLGESPYLLDGLMEHQTELHPRGRVFRSHVRILETWWAALTRSSSCGWKCA